jgi:hypothetical protein
VIPKGPWTPRRAARRPSSSFSWGVLASPGVLDYAIMELGDQAAGVAARTADAQEADVHPARLEITGSPFWGDVWPGAAALVKPELRRQSHPQQPSQQDSHGFGQRSSPVRVRVISGTVRCACGPAEADGTEPAALSWSPPRNPENDPRLGGGSSSEGRWSCSSAPRPGKRVSAGLPPG